jgi:hypothetical protein
MSFSSFMVDERHLAHVKYQQGPRIKDYLELRCDELLDICRPVNR